jgi:glycosyltransferase involved in cell wall biosynthesis
MSQSERALRVALLTDADVFAGTERHILDLARGLRGEGVNVRIACPSPAVLEDAARSEGIPVITIQKKGLLNQEAANTLAGLLKSGELDIIHAHNGRSWLTAATAVSRAGVGRCIATQHFIEPNHATQKGIKAIISKTAHHWVTERTERIIAISQAVRQSMLDRHEAPSEKITVIPNGITAPEVSPDAVIELRKSLNIEPDASLVVCAARLEPEKDIATLISAMARVVNEHPNAQCLIAGEGSQHAALEQQIGVMNLEKSVRLLGFRNDAHTIIAASDLFVLPSLAEPFGLVLLEAMSLGKPVVATRAGGPVEIVEDGVTGMLVSPKSPEEMAKVITNILFNQLISSKMSLFAAKRFADNFTVKRMAQDVHSIYSVRPRGRT